jgi:hypothetical protein
MERIATYQDFKRSVVESDFNDFMANRGDLCKAWHCAGSLFHLAEWVYAAHKNAIDRKFQFADRNGHTRSVSNEQEFPNSLGQKHPDFQLIRGIANASKHFILKPVPPGRTNPPGMPTHAANTYVTSSAFDSGAFDAATFDVAQVRQQAPGNDLDFADLAQSVMNMWNTLFAAEGW